MEVLKYNYKFFHITPIEEWGQCPFPLYFVCFYTTPYFFGLTGVTCWIFIPHPGIKPLPPAGEAQGLNHWTAREVPVSSTFE